MIDPNKTYRTRDGRAVLPKSREDARACGATRYFDGRECIHGHVAPRKTANGTCVECQKIRDARWRVNNPDRVRAIYRRYHKKHGDRRRQEAREYSYRNLGKYRSYIANRKAAKRNATPAWSERDKIQGMYWAATYLTDQLGFAIHVDHIVPLQGESVCGLHVYANLQLLPANVNIGKRNRHD